MANFYDTDEVKRSVSVRQYLKDQGVKVRGNRCAAPWRGGDDLTCAIYEKNGENNVFDNKEQRRLNVFDLCMLLEGKKFVEAKVALGDRYGVTPTKGKKRTPKKPKPKVVPDWVRVSWLLIHKDEDALLLDALLRLNKDEDQLTDIDLKWARRVALLLADELRGATLGEAVGVAIKLYHATEAKNRSASGKESAI